MRSRQITDRDPYKKAHKSYDELHDLLGNLAGKLTEVSKDVDKEFLASYRVHMLSIQTEIKTLREDVDKGVQALKSDGNVAKLELEVNWFVEECTRLRLHYTTMENDCMQMQTRYKAMMEQKVFMNEQLKAIMKRNRVLEAEIEHALKYNQKVKLTEDHNDALLWDEQNALHDATNFQSKSQERLQKELPPDNYYHEQLRRLSGQQPLSTSVFVPPANGKSSRGRSSRGSSRAGSRPTSRNSSRGSSRSVSPTRVSTPGSPARTSYKEKSFLPSTTSMKGEPDMEAGVQGPNGATLNRAMMSIRSHHSAENEDNDDVDIGFEDAVQRQQSNPNLNYDQSHSYNNNNRSNNNNNNANQFTNHHVSMRANHGSVKSLASAASDPNLFPITRGTTLNNLLTDYSGNKRGPVPKQQPLPVAVVKAKKKALAQKLRQNRDDLVDFLKHKSPAEASMEKAIADIFTEVRARKVVAAKRGAIKRYPVNFMGKDDTLNDTDIGTQSNTMQRQRAGISQSRSQVDNNISSTGGAGSGGSAGEIEGMAGTALGRRLSASASQAELNNNIPDSHRQQQAEDSQLQQGEEEKEEELLRQSLIQATGGISGLGTKQLSDNDKFSVVVKYLLDFDRFRELVAKLHENQQ